MSMANRIRSTFPTLRRSFTSSNPNSAKSFATSAPAKQENVKVPLAMYGGPANYATALYIASVKANVLDKVETELLDLVAATTEAPTFDQFTKDQSVTQDIRTKALTDICAQAKFSDIMRNLLLVLAENGRLKHVDSITKRFQELTMAHRGEVKAIVTTVIPLPAAEEQELKETLQEILGTGTTVFLEHKIDPSILGGIVVQFGDKVLDMSIKTRAQQMERLLSEPISL